MPDQQTFTFNSAVPGPHYVSYLVTNGPASAQQLVRVDVVPGNNDGAPVAVRDIALLPSGGSVLVDVLGNDSDPSGGVLVVQSVTADGRPARQRRSAGPLGGQDHRHPRPGPADPQVHHLQRQRPRPRETFPSWWSRRPPNCRPRRPSRTKRPSGPDDVVTIPVLDNDTDPNGGKLTLEPELAQQPDAADGRIFVVRGHPAVHRRSRAQNRLRHLQSQQRSPARSTPNRSPSASGPATTNATTRPEPRNLTARVVAGMVVKIPVPLDGIDADGDSVQLIGVDKAPGMGTAVVKDGYLEFTAAGTAAGTDTFTYRVRDRIGAENTGTVIVGIAPPEANNQKPIAVDDAVDVRPGRRTLPSMP